MKNIKTSIDIILSQITYNEILRGDIFNSDTLCSYKDSIIQLSDGSLCISFLLLTGDSNLSRETCTQRRDALLPIFSKLGNGFELMFELRRKKNEFCYEVPPITIGGSVKEIEKRRKIEFTNSGNFINNTYITLTYRNTNKRNIQTIQSLVEFANAAEELKNAIEASGCSAEILKNEKLISFIKYAHDFTNEKILPFKADENISKSIINADYKFKNIPLVINTTKDLFVQCFSLTALPSYTYADMFSILNNMPFEIRAVFKYKNYDKEKSKNIVMHKKKSFKNSIFSLTSYVKKEVASADIEDEYDHDALDGKLQCDAVLDCISKEDMSLGDCQITFILHSDDIEEQEKNENYFKSVMIKSGFLLKKEKLGNSLCFISAIPSNSFFYNPLLVLDKNFCDFLHLGSPTQGAKESKLLIKRTGSKIPFVYAKNLDGSNYYFSLSGKEAEKGHSFVLGPTGSGKSALLSLFVSSFLKYENTRCVIIDRDLSSLEIVSDNSGSIFYPFNDSTCFQPLHNSKKRKKEITEFIKSICYISQIEWTANEQKLLQDAIELLDEKSEIMSILYSVIKGLDSSSPLIPALSGFVKGGEYECLFDSDKDNFDINNRITLIETNKIFKNSLEDKNVALPFFIYLFTKLNELFDSCIPTLLIIDEGWKILKNPTFSHFIEEWIKTLRKKNVDIIFSATNISDIIDTNIAETIISNTETKIFFRDENAENELQKNNYKKLGISDYCINLIKNTPKFCPVVFQEGFVSAIDFKMKNIINLVTTSNDKKKKYLCED